jgi:LDH2 family malate/lactate/ureidoglycolate dehydrogenase
MATSASAYYGLVMAQTEGRTIPADVAYDWQGNPTTDPSEALRGALRVFDRSFKGSHLALMVELLAGALSGAAMTDKERNKNWGSFVLAIDPNLFGPNTLDDFRERASSMCERVKNAKPLPNSEEEIFLPGERGDRLEEQNLASGSIPLSSAVYSELLRQLS